MKIRKVASYTPDYPSKLKSSALKLGAAAAAAVLAATASGCLPRANGYMEYMPPDETAEAVTAEPTEEALLMGDVAVETLPPESEPELAGVILDPGSLPTDDGNVLEAPRDTIAPPDSGND